MTSKAGGSGHVTAAGKLEVRERVVAARELAASEREELTRLRDAALQTREELARLRDAALQAREGLEEARRERDRLAEEIREVNANLVRSLVRSHELAEEAAAAHAQIAASEERFRSLVTTSASILFQADARGRIRVDAEAWRDFTGLTPDAYDEGPGDGWLQAVHPQDRGATRTAWAVAVAGGTLFSRQHRLRRRDGGYTWVVARAVPLPTGGPVREWVGTMTDVSDRVRVEEAREQFIAILGHDLRSPLGIILLGAQMLGRAGVAEAQGATVELITRNAKRMQGMIADLLDFARGRLGGGIPVTRVPTDLSVGCAEAVAAAKLACPQREIAVEAAGDLRGEWDPARLEQVFANLLDNAIHHGVGPIRVGLRGDAAEVVVTVHSEGPPIPDALLAGIFEPFHAHTRTRSEGLGLGLYIVSEIVRAHGGVTAVRSAEGEGTTFTARWPKHAPAEARSESRPPG